MNRREPSTPQPFPLGGVVGAPLRPHRPIPPAILQRIYAEDQRFNNNWQGATNVEALIYIGGLAVLIVGGAAWFA